MKAQVIVEYEGPSPQSAPPVPMKTLWKIADGTAFVLWRAAIHSMMQLRQGDNGVVAPICTNPADDSLPTPPGSLTREAVEAFTRRLEDYGRLQSPMCDVSGHIWAAFRAVDALAAVMLREEATREKPKAE